MIGIGMSLIGLSLLALFLWWRGRLESSRWMLWLLVLGVLGPQFANQLGWMTAEVGRQPWIVQGLMRTKDAVSPNVSCGQILFSLGALYGRLHGAVRGLQLPAQRQDPGWP